MKIGFIAMSGVRAHNEELTKLGLTLPGFVDRNRIVASLPSLGLLTLAGLTPEAIEVEYTEVEDIEKLDGLPGSYDAVAISSFSAQIHEAYELADRFRAEGTKVFLGGLHVTAMPKEALAHADSIVIGEGEPVWPEAIRDLRADRLQSVYDARNVVFDLAASPIPRYELLDPDRYNRLTVQTSRGCPFDCEFCAASIRLCPTYRVKPVERVINEIQRIKELWPKPFIEFADDNTFVNKPHSKRLMRALAKEGVRWFTETDISVAEDDDLLSLMRDSGCAQVLIGLESPDRDRLHGLERKSDWKSKQFDKYLQAIDRIQGHGITVNGCFVLGLDGSGKESFAEVLDFVVRSQLYEVQITVQTAFPGTPLYERLLASDRLIEPEAWKFCTLFDVNFVPDAMTVTELEQGFRWLAERIYSEEMTQQRRRRFRERMKAKAAMARPERKAGYGH
ncbi:B12-binding domain-containing radical SAM protein [bacterium]|nr:MAG: B12-binding domain-containing radical SAM protein [bacterium]RKZ15076.1 MAG: B12-binding domain-containing radical SAM protein [bacterium]